MPQTANSEASVSDPNLVGYWPSYNLCGTNVLSENAFDLFWKSGPSWSASIPVILPIPTQISSKIATQVARELGLIFQQPPIVWATSLLDVLPEFSTRTFLAMQNPPSMISAVKRTVTPNCVMNNDRPTFGTPITTVPVVVVSSAWAVFYSQPPTATLTGKHSSTVDVHSTTPSRYPKIAIRNFSQQNVALFLSSIF